MQELCPYTVYYTTTTTNQSKNVCGRLLILLTILHKKSGVHENRRFSYDTPLLFYYLTNLYFPHFLLLLTCQQFVAVLLHSEQIPLRKFLCLELYCVDQ